MNTYPAMNDKIIGILRINDDNLACLYAAQRIEELEKENEWLKRRLLAAEGYGSWETLSSQTVDDIVQNMKDADTLHEEEV